MPITETTEPVQFDDVKVGDTLRFQRRFHDWSGAEIKLRTGTVTRITAQCIYTTDRHRLTRKGWYDACPHRIAKAADRGTMAVVAANEVLAGVKFDDDAPAGKDARSGWVRPETVLRAEGEVTRFVPYAPDGTKLNNGFVHEDAAYACLNGWLAERTDADMARAPHVAGKD